MMMTRVRVNMMRAGAGRVRCLFVAGTAWGAGAAAGACSDAPAPGGAAAHVEHAVTEDQLTSVKLSASAVRRLAIQTAAVDSAVVPPTRTVGGEVVVPPGQSVIITAPVAGAILAPLGGSVPQAGSRVARRQPLLRLAALPPDRDMGRIRQELRVAAAQLRQARSQAERVAQLYEERIVAQRQHEQAQAELSAAEAAYEGALAQQNLVLGASAGNTAGLTPLLIVAPEAGIVRQLSATPGQAVAAGTPLVEILQTGRMWIRVPVYAGEAARFDRGAHVAVHGLAGAESGPAIVAAPVSAPPSANAASASVDLYYELRGGAGVFRPGERVGVTIPLAGGEEHALVVPLSSVVRDMSGGSWVYVRADSLTFVRRRVEVTRIAGDRAVLAMGPPPGTLVVTDGAAELFGTEFGAGH